MAGHRIDRRMDRLAAAVQERLGDGEIVQAAVYVNDRHPLSIPRFAVKTQVLAVTDRAVRLSTPRRSWLPNEQIKADLGVYHRDVLNTAQPFSHGTRLDLGDNRRAFIHPDYWRRLVERLSA